MLQSLDPCMYGARRGAAEDVNAGELCSSGEALMIPIRGNYLRHESILILGGLLLIKLTFCMELWRSKVSAQCL